MDKVQLRNDASYWILKYECARDGISTKEIIQIYKGEE